MPGFLACSAGTPLNPYSFRIGCSCFNIKVLVMNYCFYFEILYQKIGEIIFFSARVKSWNKFCLMKRTSVRSQHAIKKYCSLCLISKLSLNNVKTSVRTMIMYNKYDYLNKQKKKHLRPLSSCLSEFLKLSRKWIYYKKYI